MNRRDFLRNSALATAGTMLIPAFLRAQQYNAGNKNGNILVVIQLSGGNDGLNTVIPFRNDIYYRERPTLAIERSKVLSLNDEIGLNPALTSLRALYDDGRARVVNNVGYPNPDRSHFRSMDIWQTASSSKEYLTTGWLGRYLDSECNDCKGIPHKMLEIDDTLSLAMKGAKGNGLALLDPARLYRQAKNGMIENLMKATPSLDGKTDTVSYLYKTLADTESSADYLYQNSKIQKAEVAFPNNELGKSLRTVAELINSGVDSTVYYVSISGFDTHAGQLGRQERLLSQYDQSIGAFVSELKKKGQLDRTMVLTFSEFGRRVKENGSKGTDHGTANNVFLVGGPSRSSLVYNESPVLTDLDGGDLRFSIDFRDIYTSLLRDWLGANDEIILGKGFKGLKGLV